MKSKLSSLLIFIPFPFPYPISPWTDPPSPLALLNHLAQVAPQALTSFSHNHSLYPL